MLHTKMPVMAKKICEFPVTEENGAYHDFVIEILPSAQHFP